MTSAQTLPLTALISVSDKTGVLELAHGLHALGVRLLSTGGTAKLLSDADLPVTEVAAHTGFPEMLDGRVKTLHPTIHGGLLARRDLPEHMQALQQHGISAIDILVVNLYPFEATVVQEGCTLDDAIENIDIGGPAMVRSAAKNWRDVIVLTDAAQYTDVLAALQTGEVPRTKRFELAVAAFNRIANYDAAISDYLSASPQSCCFAPGPPRGLSHLGSGPAIDLRALPLSAAEGQIAQPLTFSAQANPRFVKLQDLRYGENPHQSAAFYRDLAPPAGSLVTAHQHQGKALSYNNIADADAAWECVKSFDPQIDGRACVIVKHANPCGVALGSSVQAAYSKALQTDPTSAFGGIIAFNSELDAATAADVVKLFVEVLIAPSFSSEALKVLANKPNTRVLQIAWPKGGSSAAQEGRNLIDFKRVSGGLLIQTADHHPLQASDLKVVTKQVPTPQQIKDLLFAWKIAQYVKSNAIVFSAQGMTLGVGAGQMSRIDSARIARIKADHAKLSLQGSCVASDAFFPFRDGLDVVVDAGAQAVIQPGGSVRDEEVITAANEHGIAMVLTGVRHFRH
jgi:phosphoribosylaminoimidazolecarboxamide formyltransferase / IMP cyclohydrolase